ncbi:MAG: TetR family transcriptional regulator [Proteobacteria bacterium]|nr:TetR family transcriptional regulator [Pseudomonadota bacterium]MBU6426308.1 TetR family transcriptional regulator [Rhodospirillales bacterium]
MTDQEFEAALLDAAFALGAEAGWLRVSAAAAARRAGLDLARARSLFPCTAEILRKFGHQADAAALSHVAADGSVRDKLFDILMRRFDYLQPRRAGVKALLRVLPFCPPLALAMAEMNLTSMGWLLEGAGVEATGFAGALKKRGLLAVWLYGLRAWAQDESPDLTATMAAVDKALARAEDIVQRQSPFATAAPPAESPTPEAEDPAIP